MCIIYTQTGDLRLPFRFGKGSRVALQGASRKHKEVSGMFTKPATWHRRTGPCSVYSGRLSMIHIGGKIMPIVGQGNTSEDED